MSNSSAYEIRKDLLLAAFDYYRQVSELNKDIVIKSHQATARIVEQSFEQAQEQCVKVAKQYEVNLDDVLKLAKKFNEFVSKDN